MGKKKIDNIKFIENKNHRNVTYSKRKKGIVKKAIELSSLCGQEIYMVIFDKEKQKLVEFKSTGDFNSKIVNALTQQDVLLQFKYESYMNQDYPMFQNEKEPVENDQKQVPDLIV